MDKQFLYGQVKAVDADARSVTAYASTGDLDRDVEVIQPSAWEKTIEQFGLNPVVMWAHDYRIPPVAKASDLLIDDKGLKFKAAFARTDFAEEIWSLYRDGFLNAFSVGFIAHRSEEGQEGDGDDSENDDGKTPRRTFTECELLEISCVPVPANPHALVERGVPIVSFKQVTDFALPEDAAEAKSVVPFAATAPADEGRSWDAAAARARLRQWAGGEDWSPAKYRRGFVFVDGEPDLLGSYKGPHHDVDGGNLVVVWRGVSAAMGSLVFGARGGRIADEGDRRGVYGHLKKHYAQFNKEPPDFRDYDEEELKVLFPELYAKGEMEPTEGDKPTEELDAPDELPQEVVDALAQAIEQVTAILTGEQGETQDG